MNHIYKLKFNRNLLELIIVSELATNAVSTSNPITLSTLTSQSYTNISSSIYDCSFTDLICSIVTVSYSLYNSSIKNYCTLSSNITNNQLASNFKSLSISNYDNFTSRNLLALSLLVASVGATTNVFAAPTVYGTHGQEGSVVSGTVNSVTSGLVTTITNSPNAIIDWKSFNINQNEILKFVQNSSDSAVLNRVLGGSVSKILGSLQSNGQVFIINPNGIVFGKNSHVNVGGLVASTLDIDNNDFLHGHYVFNKAKDQAIAKVLNSGVIKVNNDGSLALIGGQVVNNGVLEAKHGTVFLLAGNSIEIADLHNPLVSYKVTAKNKAVNLGRIIGQNALLLGNKVLNGKASSYTSGAFADVIGSNANNANSATINADGQVVLFGGSEANTLQSTDQANNQVVGKRNGVVVNNGKINVSNAHGKAGKVQVLGDTVVLDANSKIYATGRTGGEVLIGGDAAGKGTLKLAHQTYLDQDQLVDLSAEDQAGHAVVWADQTHLDGNFKATSVNSDGGFIETSGHVIDFGNKNFNVNLESEHSQAGTWLVDPDHIAVVNASNLDARKAADLATAGGQYDFQDPSDWDVSQSTTSTLSSTVKEKAGTTYIKDSVLSKQLTGKKVELEAKYGIDFDHAKVQMNSVTSPDVANSTLLLKANTYDKTKNSSISFNNSTFSGSSINILVEKDNKVPVYIYDSYFNKENKYYNDDTYDSYFNYYNDDNSLKILGLSNNQDLESNLIIKNSTLNRLMNVTIESDIINPTIINSSIDSIDYYFRSSSVKFSGKITKAFNIKETYFEVKDFLINTTSDASAVRIENSTIIANGNTYFGKNNKLEFFNTKFRLYNILKVPDQTEDNVITANSINFNNVTLFDSQSSTTLDSLKLVTDKDIQLTNLTDIRLVSKKLSINAGGNINLTNFTLLTYGINTVKDVEVEAKKGIKLNNLILGSTNASFVANEENIELNKVEASYENISLTAEKQVAINNATFSLDNIKITSRTTDAKVDKTVFISNSTFSPENNVTVKSGNSIVVKNTSFNRSEVSLDAKSLVSIDKLNAGRGKTAITTCTTDSNGNSKILITNSDIREYKFTAKTDNLILTDNIDVSGSGASILDAKYKISIQNSTVSLNQISMPCMTDSTGNRNFSIVDSHVGTNYFIVKSIDSLIVNNSSLGATCLDLSAKKQINIDKSDLVGREFAIVTCATDSSIDNSIYIKNSTLSVNNFTLNSNRSFVLNNSSFTGANFSLFAQEQVVIDKAKIKDPVFKITSCLTDSSIDNGVSITNSTLSVNDFTVNSNRSFVLNNSSFTGTYVNLLAQKQVDIDKANIVAFNSEIKSCTTDSSIDNGVSIKNSKFDVNNVTVLSNRSIVFNNATLNSTSDPAYSRFYNYPGYDKFHSTNGNVTIEHSKINNLFHVTSDHNAININDTNVFVKGLATIKGVGISVDSNKIEINNSTFFNSDNELNLRSQGLTNITNTTIATINNSPFAGAGKLSLLNPQYLSTLYYKNGVVNITSQSVNINGSMIRVERFLPTVNKDAGYITINNSSIRALTGETVDYILPTRGMNATLLHNDNIIKDGYFDESHNIANLSLVAPFVNIDSSDLASNNLNIIVTKGNLDPHNTIYKGNHINFTTNSGSIKLATRKQLDWKYAPSTISLNGYSGVSVADNLEFTKSLDIISQNGNIEIGSAHNTNDGINGNSGFNTARFIAFNGNISVYNNITTGIYSLAKNINDADVITNNDINLKAKNINLVTSDTVHGIKAQSGSVDLFASNNITVGANQFITASHNTNVNAINHISILDKAQVNAHILDSAFEKDSIDIEHNTYGNVSVNANSLFLSNGSLSVDSGDIKVNTKTLETNNSKYHSYRTSVINATNSILGVNNTIVSDVSSVNIESGSFNLDKLNVTAQKQVLLNSTGNDQTILNHVNIISKVDKVTIYGHQVELSNATIDAHLQAGIVVDNSYNNINIGTKPDDGYLNIENSTISSKTNQVYLGSNSEAVENLHTSMSVSNSTLEGFDGSYILDKSSAKFTNTKLTSLDPQYGEIRFEVNHLDLLNTTIDSSKGIAVVGQGRYKFVPASDFNVTITDSKLNANGIIYSYLGNKYSELGNLKLVNSTVTSNSVKSPIILHVNGNTELVNSSLVATKDINVYSDTIVGSKQAKFTSNTGSVKLTADYVNLADTKLNSKAQDIKVLTQRGIDLGANTSVIAQSDITLATNSGIVNFIGKADKGILINSTQGNVVVSTDITNIPSHTANTGSNLFINYASINGNNVSVVGSGILDTTNAIFVSRKANLGVTNLTADTIKLHPHTYVNAQNGIIINATTPNTGSLTTKDVAITTVNGSVTINAVNRVDLTNTTVTTDKDSASGTVAIKGVVDNLNNATINANGIKVSTNKDGIDSTAVKVLGDIKVSNSILNGTNGVTLDALGNSTLTDNKILATTGGVNVIAGDKLKAIGNNIKANKEISLVSHSDNTVDKNDLILATGVNLSTVKGNGTLYLGKNNFNDHQPIKANADTPNPVVCLYGMDKNHHYLGYQGKAVCSDSAGTGTGTGNHGSTTPTSPQNPSHNNLSNNVNPGNSRGNGSNGGFGNNGNTNVVTTVTQDLHDDIANDPNNLALNNQLGSLTQFNKELNTKKDLDLVAACRPRFITLVKKYNISIRDIRYNNEQEIIYKYKVTAEQAEFLFNCYARNISYFDRLFENKNRI